MNTSMIQLGFDGGGTNSKMIVRDSEGRMLKRSFLLSIKYTDVGVGESVRRFIEMLHTLAPEETYSNARIAIALSGASDSEKNNEFKQLLSAKLSEKTIDCTINSDAIVTLEAAYKKDQSGFLLIAGTGSVALCKDREGIILKAGGLGRMLGDEGSGYWLGLQALKFFAAELEHPTNNTDGILYTALSSALEPLVQHKFDRLRSMLYSNDINPAQFAEIVIESYNDPIAAEILERGAIFLAGLIRTLDKRSNGTINRILSLHGAVAISVIYQQMISTSLNDEFQLRPFNDWAVAEYALETVSK